jgi:RNA polymerase sigma-70 factor (ECF subfamily)
MTVSLQAALHPGASATLRFMPVEQSDEALMMAYRDGDARAFELLYARHRGGLYRFVLRQCATRSIADELFQDVWTNVIAARGRYVPSAKFSTFLYQVARNRVIDFYRATGRRREDAEEDDPVDPPAPVAAQPDRMLERRQHASRMLAAIESLPPVQREAFLLHEEGGFTLEEIAQITEVGRETVKSRLRYALARLREQLEDLL